MVIDYTNIQSSFRKSQLRRNSKKINFPLKGLIKSLVAVTVITSALTIPLFVRSNPNEKTYNQLIRCGTEQGFVAKGENSFLDVAMRLKRTYTHLEHLPLERIETGLKMLNRDYQNIQEGYPITLPKRICDESKL